MTNCEKIRNAVQPCTGQVLPSDKIVSLVLSLYPGTNAGSIIPSDHAGPNPRSGRSYCSCSGTTRQIFSRTGSEYLVRDGTRADSRAVQQPSTTVIPNYVFTSSVREGDLVAVKRALSELKSSIRPSTDRAWRRAAALRVIDCVLSLNRPYDSFVFGLGIAGFGLGGFQYLRMLFGANTTKPDVHIQRYVASVVGHRVSDIQALALLEAAAKEAGVCLRDLDTTVWEKSARDS